MHEVVNKRETASTRRMAEGGGWGVFAARNARLRGPYRLLVFVLLWAAAAGGEATIRGAELNDHALPRDYYNQGTQKLRTGKLREAENSLETAVQNGGEQVQTPALYNLGHVRFRQGLEALKEAEKNALDPARANLASATGKAAIQDADEALAGHDVGALLRAYMHGQGARKQLKAAITALKRAMDTYSAVLSRWQRASGDFKSAHELRPKYENAEFNAQVVDQHIAELIDREKPFQMSMAGASQTQQELRQRLQQLKKRLPPGSLQQNKGDKDEDDEDDQEQPKEPKAGQKEELGRQGREIGITPDEAARLLEALRLDANRKLPMGVEETSQLKERRGRDW
jgi:hypothetical protein